MATSVDEKQRCSASLHNQDTEKPQSVTVDDAQKQLAEEKDVPAAVDLSPEELGLSKRINRKMDFAMLPILSILYLFNGLDKGNVGNAETQGK